MKIGRRWRLEQERTDGVSHCQLFQLCVLNGIQYSRYVEASFTAFSILLLDQVLAVCQEP